MSAATIIWIAILALTTYSITVVIRDRSWRRARRVHISQKVGVEAEAIRATTKIGWISWQTHREMLGESLRKPEDDE